MHDSFVSVVIPVLNDPAGIKRCLEALERQTYPKDRYEVIVVDNGSTDGTKQTIERFAVCGSRFAGEDRTANRIPHIVNPRYVYEPIRGLHQARNAGIKEAKGEVLAFTDADCIPAPDWIEEGVEAILSTPNCGLGAGRIDVFAETPGKPTAAELFEIVTAFRQKEYLERWHFAAPANVFTKREVISKVGVFRGTLKSGADIEWGKRVFNAGYKQFYSEKTIVKHPARHSLKRVLQKHRRVVGGLYDIRKGKYPLRSFLIDLKDDWPRLMDIYNMLSGKNINKLSDKLKVFMVSMLVKSVRIFERIRLYFFGKSIWG